MRLTFMALLAGVQLITLAVASWTLGSASNDVLSARLSADLVNASRESTAKIESYLDGPNRLAELLAGLVVTIGERNDAQIEATFLEALDHTPHATGAFIGRADGSFVFVSKTPDGGFSSKIIQVTGTTRTVIKHLRPTSSAVATIEVVTDDTYDPRTRPWFKLATEQQGSAWTEPYNFATSKKPGITTASMIDPSQPNSSVVGVDIELAEIHQYVESLRVSPKGSAVIVDRRSQRLGGASRALIPADLADPADTPVVTRYQSSGRNMAMVVRQIPGSPGWRIAFASPESDYFAESGRLQSRLIKAVLVSAMLTSALALVLFMLLKQRVDSIAQKAHVDKLTGILNRARMLELAERRLQRNQRSGLSTYVCLLDVDFYKDVNDTYGHDAGDRVLETISRRLGDSTRTNDLIGRYGGDEFLVVFDEVNQASAESMVERLRRRVSDEPIDLGDHLVVITTSAGLAVASGGPQGSVPLHDVVSEADRALYRAKQRGRNQLVTTP
jgi:diguanylate cyclase (GGDEF)-like protein